MVKATNIPFQLSLPVGTLMTYFLTLWDKLSLKTPGRWCQRWPWKISKILISQFWRRGTQIRWEIEDFLYSENREYFVGQEDRDLQGKEGIGENVVKAVGDKRG